MRFRVKVIVLFVGALLLLRHGILFVDTHLDVRSEQAASVETHGIDPRALFYAESKVALAAEKDFRRKLH